MRKQVLKELKLGRKCGNHQKIYEGWRQNWIRLKLNYYSDSMISMSEITNESILIEYKI
jgi:hypothetical protein